MISMFLKKLRGRKVLAIFKRRYYSHWRIDYSSIKDVGVYPYKILSRKHGKVIQNTFHPAVDPRWDFLMVLMREEIWLVLNTQNHWDDEELERSEHIVKKKLNQETI